MIKLNNENEIVVVKPRSKRAIKGSMNIKKILYISCNPATLARDIKILSEKYTPSAITPVDMFPHTNHVECVVLLTSNF